MSTPMRDERLARAMRPVEEALRLHALCRGKMQTLPKCPVRGFEDFALVFPGLFRGVLDVRARTITDEMASAVARELARFAQARGVREASILPRMDEWDLHPRVAAVTAMAAQAQGLAGLSRTAEDVASHARRLMQRARDATAALMEAGLIAGA